MLAVHLEMFLMAYGDYRMFQEQHAPVQSLACAAEKISWLASRIADTYAQWPDVASTVSRDFFLQKAMQWQNTAESHIEWARKHVDARR